MISACDTQEFVPYGRNVIALHPGKRQQLLNASNVHDHGLPFVKALKDITISGNAKKDSWQLRKLGQGKEGSDEELYISDKTAVWSYGSMDTCGKVVKTFTMDSPIKQALWCSFLLPVDTTANPHLAKDKTSSNTVAAHEQKGVCIVENNTLGIFLSSGKDHETTLNFPVTSVHAIKNGLLFERAAQEKQNDISKTPKRDQFQKNLPVVFSMLHPLDEIAPVICRTGGNTNNAKVTKMTEVSQQIVYTNEEPSLAVTYDNILGVHSVWCVRRAKPEEIYQVMGESNLMVENANPNMSVLAHETTPGMSKSVSALSRLTLSSQSPSISRSYGSKVNSPSLSKLNSPSLSLHAAFSRSQSPSITSASIYRLQTPSPMVMKNSPISRTPLSGALNASMMEQTNLQDGPEPLVPELCLDHLWTETGMPRDGPMGKANKVFLTEDLCGQKFLCYLVSFRHQLRCVKIKESNDKSKMIFGNLSAQQAKDAIPLPSLKMLLMLDLHNTLTLFSGSQKISQIHIPGLPSPLCQSLAPSTCPSTSFQTPSGPYRGPYTSSRPPSATDFRFGDEMRQLSPVPTEFNDSSIIDTSITDAEVSFQPSAPSSMVAALKDSVDNRFTLELTDGSFYRTCLPEMTTCPIIGLCLEAMQTVLPKNIALQAFIRWYLTLTAPGRVNGQSEWTQFVKYLLGLMGYNIEKMAICHKGENNGRCSPELLTKKSKPAEEGEDKDWLYLLNSNHHSLSTDSILNPDNPNTVPSVVSEPATVIDTSALLFTNMPAILFAMHLVYEELRLDSCFFDKIEGLAELLKQLASDLQCDLYIDQYCRNHPSLFDNVKEPTQVPPDLLPQMSYPNYLTKVPPNIYDWLTDISKGSTVVQFPLVPDVCTRTKNVIILYTCLQKVDDFNKIPWHQYVRYVSAHGKSVPDLETTFTKDLKPTSQTYNVNQRIVLLMTQLGVGKDEYACGVSLPLKEAIFHCRDHPPGDWPELAYSLICREDLAKQKRQVNHVMNTDSESMASVKGVKEEDDGMEYLEKKLLKLRYGEDLRMEEVRRLLQSAKPVKISLTQRPEVSDHDFIEEQEKHLYALCIRTMALSVGRGVLTLCTYRPLPTETLGVPKLCLTGRAPPRNTTVDLTHIDTPQDMSHWPQFHNGVAAGLRIVNGAQLDSKLILNNKPKSNDLTNEHAGLLMGLGMNGHLTGLATLNVHDYLCRGHEMTSVGLLLGLAAGRRGTMDVSVTRILSIHLSALLPPTSTELDVPHTVQVAAVMGIGLLYLGTAHRHISEVLLEEIGRAPGPEMENSAERESYSLAAGLALGMVMLEKGGDSMAMSDLSMADELYHYMVGGKKRNTEGDSVNVDVTSPGATLALGMMYFRSNNSAVAEWLAAPDTQFLLDFVRPDFLMLRTIARGLVLWDAVYPSEEWLKTNTPEIVLTYAFNKVKYKDDPDCDVDFETMSQAYCNIMGGACLVLGLRFAGSANQAAFQTLLDLAKKILKLMSKPALAEQAGKSTVENCLCVVVLSLAIVMAGTGNLEVLRICRHLRSRVGQSYSTYVLYGSHMAISMAIGLLFMGGGRYTLSTKPEAIAAMLCAFFPKFPIHSNDNRYHLQALRHLYVLAGEPRVIMPIDVDSTLPCYVPMEITFKDTEQYRNENYVTMAPCVLPELHLIKEMKVKGPRYWEVSFHCDKNWNNLINLIARGGNLYVKQRAGHLSYAADPKGYHSVLAQSLTKEQPFGKIIKTEDIQSFSSDPRILAFAEYFCSNASEQEYCMSQLLSKVLYECVSQEKLDILSTYITLHKAIAKNEPSPSLLWQLKSMIRYYEKKPKKKRGSLGLSRLASEEILLTLSSALEDKLEKWLESAGDTLYEYFSGQPVKQSHLLSSFLTWYNIPSPAVLADLNLQGPPSFPQLYMLLKDHGTSVSTCMTLANVLNSVMTR